jgi:hypothetical protein
MPDEPESDGCPETGGLAERDDRYLLAASRLNIEMSLIGSEQTLWETDRASSDREQMLAGGDQMSERAQTA